jgi:hypothetical protein
LREFAPFWSEISIVRSAEFLGFFVGPDSHKNVWSKPLAKFANRVACIRRSGVGLASSVVLFNVCALPVLSHVAQLFTPSLETILLVETLSPRIIAAPKSWVEHFVLTHLRLLLPFKQDLLDFKTFCLAVRCRVMFRQFPSWTAFDASKFTE